MAEARSEEEDESMTRDTREQQVVRRQSNSSGGHPNRRKPEHRHSQGPLSSIRAAIKRTSNRSTSLSECSRERERDRDRDRRRPEITILSAEPLASTSWFPGTSGGFPPPPPPAAQIWGPTIPPSIQPPPSYEEVIREKTQEQGLLPSSSSSSSSSHPASTITIATQTDPGSAPDLGVKRPVRPSRPPFPYPSKPSHVDDSTPSESTCTSLDSDSVLNIHPEAVRPGPVHTQYCDLSTELCSPLTSNSGAQTDETDQIFAAAEAATPPQVLLERPRPRPRSRLSAPPVSSEVKVQTLVKLREDGLATLAARAGANKANQEVSQGKYLQELLEAFSADDWGFPEHRSDSSEHSQSESEENEEEGVEEDMATLKARIQAFEQQPVADGGCGNGDNRNCDTTKKPEPRPRPRLQAQPAKSVPPTVAPKPKNFSQAPKPSTKFLETSGLTPISADSCSSEGLQKLQKTAETDQTANELAHSLSPKLCSDVILQPCKKTEKPSLRPKPSTETHPPCTSVPVPAPRPAPSKPETNPKPPLRPAVTPRASIGAVNLEKGTPAGNITPTLPPRPSSGAQAETGSDETQDALNKAVKGSIRPGLPSKPAALSSPRRASAPNLATKHTGAAASLSDSSPTPAKPPGPVSSVKHAAPAPALRKGPVIQPKPETTNSSQSSEPPLPPQPSNIKPLPLRPPPIKSTPGRPPPPAITAINSTSPTNQMTPPTSKASPVTSVSSTSQPSSSQTNSVVSATQTSQRAPKKGPPLPPRPKPGHPLFNSYMKQDVLIVLDDPRPSEDPSDEGRSQTIVASLINPSQCLLDLDVQPNPAPELDGQSKPALVDLSLSDSQSILPLQTAEQKEQPDPSPVSGPRCVALFDYEGEENDELTFSQGDVISLLELVGQEWARGKIHGRVGIFPLNFAEVVEPLPPSVPSSVEMPNEPNTSQGSHSEAKGWAVALFDFPGQTAEDLSFHKGAIIQVMEHIDAEWRRGRLEGKEGLYPAAFTQSCQGQPIPGLHSAVQGVVKFDFTAESEDELTLKAGDIVTQVESVDEQWIVGTAGGKRGIVPKSFISIL